MTIRVHWDNVQHTALHFDIMRFDGWDEFVAARQTIGTLCATVDHAVDFVITMASDVAPPPGALHQFRNFQDHRPANLDLSIIVAPHLFVRTLANAFVHMYPQHRGNIVLVETLADAQALVARRHPTAEALVGSPFRAPIVQLRRA